jgi:hypothetical protein
MIGNEQIIELDTNKTLKITFSENVEKKFLSVKFCEGYCDVSIEDHAYAKVSGYSLPILFESVEKNPNDICYDLKCYKKKD